MARGGIIVPEGLGEASVSTYELDPRILQYVRTDLTDSQIKALRNTPVNLMGQAAVGTNEFAIVEQVFVSFFNLAGPYTESADNLLIEYDNGTRQVETATIHETVPGTLIAGNMTCTVTAAGMVNSPKAVTVAVATNDTEAQVATKVRAALTADADVSAFFTVSGATTAVILTAKVAVANDGTMNIATADDTSVGIATTASSANTTAGVVGKAIMTIEATGLVDVDNSGVNTIPSAAVMNPSYIAATFVPPPASEIRIRNSGDGEYGGGGETNIAVVTLLYRIEPDIS